MNELNPTAEEDSLLEPMKRPFCNAFTGCGKKRSSSVDDLMHLSNKIIGEARAWEMFQRRLHSGLAGDGGGLLKKRK